MQPHPCGHSMDGSKAVPGESEVHHKETPSLGEEEWQGQ